MIKSIILSVEWYYYSDNVVQHIHDNYYSDDHDSYSHHDDRVTTIDDDDDSEYSDNEPAQQGGEYSQGGAEQGGEGGEGQEGEEGQAEGGEMGEMGDEGGEMGQQGQQDGQEQGQGEGHGDESDDSEEEEKEKEKEAEVDIPLWFSIVAWSCVGWYFLGGLFGMFAGCNSKKCCAFMFWIWWVITMTVSFALGVMVLYFVGVHWCLLVMFTLAMAIGIYFTVKVKKFYNLLRDDAPAGYSDIYANDV